MLWGVTLNEIELSVKPTDQDETNISFKHTSYLFERGEKFEFDEFLSSHLN
jgi:hypothetical protein